MKGLNIEIQKKLIGTLKITIILQLYLVSCIHLIKNFT